jgi:hypothetical protein
MLDNVTLWYHLTKFCWANPLSRWHYVTDTDIDTDIDTDTDTNTDTNSDINTDIDNLTDTDAVLILIKRSITWVMDHDGWMDGLDILKLS